MPVVSPPRDGQSGSPPMRSPGRIERLAPGNQGKASALNANPVGQVI